MSDLYLQDKDSATMGDEDAGDTKSDGEETQEE